MNTRALVGEMDAARQCGIFPEDVEREVRRGRIVATVVDGARWYRADEVDRLAKFFDELRARRPWKPMRRWRERDMGGAVLGAFAEARRRK